VLGLSRFTPGKFVVNVLAASAAGLLADAARIKIAESI
jgi:hypothetical protein